MHPRQHPRGAAASGQLQLRRATHQPTRPALHFRRRPRSGLLCLVLCCYCPAATIVLFVPSSALCATCAVVQVDPLPEGPLKPGQSLDVSFQPPGAKSATKMQPKVRGRGSRVVGRGGAGPGGVGAGSGPGHSGAPP